MAVLLPFPAGSELPAPPISSAQIRFDYDNPGLDPPRYSIVIDESGKGHYRSEPASHPPDPTSAEMPTQPRDVDLTLSQATRDYLFSTARARRHFALNCEDGKGKMALQGKKVLAYDGSDGSGACTYNWSKDERIERLTRIFEAISTTLEAGGRLQMEHRHDLLALDRELSALAADVKEGRAAEISNIALVLRSIVEDESVMQRARATARVLLREPAGIVK